MAKRKRRPIPRLHPEVHNLLRASRKLRGFTYVRAAHLINDHPRMKRDHASPSWIAGWEHPKNGRCYLGFVDRWHALCDVYEIPITLILGATGFLERDDE